MSKSAPPRFTFDDFIGVLIAVHDDAAEGRVVFGQELKWRLAVLERLGVLMQVGKPQVFAALKGAQLALDGEKKG